MSMWQEFKLFAMKGSVIDMAIGIVTGAAFGKIVSSLVGDVIMPPLGLLIGGVDFSDLSVTLKAAVGGVPAVTPNYGKFVQTIFDFMIVSAAVFIAVKMIIRLRIKEEQKPAPPAAPTKDQEILSEIRDLLKSRIQ
jgi:large conductance mechanosensitive channel